MRKLVLKIGAAVGKDLNPRNYRRIKRACSHPHCEIARCKYVDDVSAPASKPSNAGAASAATTTRLPT